VFRTFRGKTYRAIPSPFLMELPRKEMEQNSLVSMSRQTSDGFDVSQLAPEDDFTDGFGSGSADVDDEYAQLPPKSKIKTPGDPRFTPLKTGSDLLADQKAGRYAPERFFQGMHVKHAEYGIGQIVALSGQGPKRMATVRFLKDGDEKRMVLAFAPLEPVDEEE
jgi:DNA helicase-2/ATP-dependent DNA helicase PcrA